MCSYTEHQSNMKQTAKENTESAFTICFTLLHHKRLEVCAADRVSRVRWVDDESNNYSQSISPLTRPRLIKPTIKSFSLPQNFNTKVRQYVQIKLHFS